MKRALSAAAALAATAALIAPLMATADHRPGHPNNTNPHFTISVDPAIQVWPRQTTISGLLKTQDNTGKPVELQAKPHPYTGRYDTVATGTTDDEGTVTFLQRPGEHTLYRLVATEPNPDEISGEVTARVRMKITRRVSDRHPIKGDEITFSGRVGPAHEGETVLIQRRRPSGTWKTMTSTPLGPELSDETSAYSTEVEMNRDGVWRAKIRADENHRGNKSRRVRIEVT